MIDGPDVRTCPGVHERLAYCIEKDMTSGAIYRDLSNFFLHARMPNGIPTVNDWLHTAETWKKFVALLGRERTETVWEKNAIRIRRSGRKLPPQTLDEILGSAAA
jgi:hypothetical protein